LTIKEIDPAVAPREFGESYCDAFSGGAWHETHDPKVVVRHMVKTRRRNKSRVLGCFLNDIAVGGAHFVQLSRYSTIAKQLDSGLKDGHYLIDIWLSSSCQDRGFGSTMLAHVEQAVASLGSPRISLWTHADYQPLVDFYQRKGYLPVSKVDPQGGGPERIVFTKDILVLSRRAA
jgi:GNAT superfamily N-acetyltransferase